jgi:hypothetical protein
MLEAQTRIIEAVRCGASIDEAARQAGRSVATVRRWLTEGRKQDGKHGDFARAVDEARAAQRVVFGDGPMSYVEVERVLTDAIRRGSMPAVKMWLGLHPQDVPQAVDDPFAEFDPPGVR